MSQRETLVSLPANFANETDMARLRSKYVHEVRALRDLYVQMQCHCRLASSDGFVTEDQVGMLVYPDTLKTGLRDAGRLAAEGLVERAVGGFMVPGYFRGNRAQSEAERMAAGKAEGAKRANHERWHVRRDEIVPGCEFCQYTDESTDQSTDQYSDQSTDACTDEYSDQFTESDADSADQAELFQRDTPPIVPPTAQADEDPDPLFTEFWSVYPLKRGKPRARKAWKAAMKRRHDPELIIKAAVAYRDDPKRSPDFTAHASTWLNDERYNDEPGRRASMPHRYPTSPWEN